MKTIMRLTLAIVVSLASLEWALAADTQPASEYRAAMTAIGYTVRVHRAVLDVMGNPVKDRHGRSEGYGGSGVCVAVDLKNKTADILTCKHVSPRAQDRYAVCFSSTGTWSDGVKETPCAAKWIAVDPKADLALIRADMSGDRAWFRAAPLASVMPTPGTRCAQVGFPYDPEAKAARLHWNFGEAIGFQGSYDALPGAQAAVHSDNRGVPNWRATMRTASGDSGSGVYNQYGELVAIVWGERCSSTDITQIKSFLAQTQQCPDGRCLPWGQRPAPGPAPSPSAGSSDVRRELADLRKMIESLRPGTGEKGNDGAPGRDGQNGAKGDKGDKGEKGEPGKDGKDADTAAIMAAIEALGKRIDSIPKSPPAERVRIVPAQ